MRRRGSESESVASPIGLGPFEISGRAPSTTSGRKEAGKRVGPSRYNTFIKERRTSLPADKAKTSHSRSADNLALSWDVAVGNKQTQRTVKSAQRSVIASRTTPEVVQGRQAKSNVSKSRSLETTAPVSASVVSPALSPSPPITQCLRVPSVNASSNKEREAVSNRSGRFVRSGPPLSGTQNVEGSTSRSYGWTSQNIRSELIKPSTNHSSSNKVHLGRQRSEPNR